MPGVLLFPFICRSRVRPRAKTNTSAAPASLTWRRRSSVGCCLGTLGKSACPPPPTARRKTPTSSPLQPAQVLHPVCPSSKLVLTGTEIHINDCPAPAKANSSSCSPVHLECSPGFPLTLRLHRSVLAPLAPHLKLYITQLTSPPLSTDCVPSQHLKLNTIPLTSPWLVLFLLHLPPQPTQPASWPRLPCRRHDSQYRAAM